MRKSVKSALAAALCGATALAALPAEVLAGPMSAASPTSLGLTTSVEKAYYRGYRRGYYPRHGGYYRRGYGYGYAVPGAVAGVAAGLLGAGIAGASGYGYGGGYGGSSCWQWDAGAGWVWGC
jgi:hypothetical protein